jgi:hypothetical protein
MFLVSVFRKNGFFILIFILILIVILILILIVLVLVLVLGRWWMVDGGWGPSGGRDEMR